MWEIYYEEPLLIKKSQKTLENKEEAIATNKNSMSDENMQQAPVSSSDDVPRNGLHQLNSNIETVNLAP